MHIAGKTHGPCLRLDLRSKRPITNQQKMYVCSTFENGTSDLKKKAVILRSVESADVTYHRRTTRDSQLGANVTSINGLFKRQQIESEAENLKAVICLPVLAKQLGCWFGRS
ncbi:MAG TPA: hypothetical protein VN881_08185 [Candidatus Acidoferrales bacterium]|nr:hypothetical protein [Candidatus Acidoferrales bacterium]